jgi:transcriptional regulator with PAS, ATPase and Fis domain
VNEKQKKSRWPRLLQLAAEPLFLLDSQRKVLFVNSAFGQLTGLTAEQIIGQTCRHQLTTTTASLEAMLSTLAPPLEVVQGRPATIRRSAPDEKARYWDLHYFPLSGAGDAPAILGRIVPLATTSGPDATPLPARLPALRDRIRSWHRLDGLRSDVPAMQRVLDQVRLALPNLEPVWISGEAGSGKRWLARLIHQEGKSHARIFLSLDCRRLPPHLIHEQLLSKQGAVESGRVGSVYLKEPRWLPRELQAHLVHWLRARRETQLEHDDQPRLLIGSQVAPAANAEWLDEFRCAFSTLHIELPPLRERRADLRALTERLLGRASQAAGRTQAALSEEAWNLVLTAAWPGNARELFTVLRQACHRARGDLVHAADLPWHLRAAPPTPDRPLALDGVLAEVERRLILLALEKSKERKSGKVRVNKARAAELLSIWRARLIRRLKELGIDGSDAGEDGPDETGANPGV